MSGRPPRPRAILFDWDNTLVDTWPVITEATAITLAAMGHAPWSATEMRARIAGSLRDTFPRIYGERWPEAMKIYYQAFERVHLDRLRALPGAADALGALGDAGVYLGVVSNKTGKYLRAEADHLGWTPRFGRLVGAQDVARDKPAADPVLAALAPAGVSPGADVWFVGDAEIDVVCGQAAGCTTVLVPPPGGAEPADMAVQPTLRVPDLSSLVAAVTSDR
ncbi:MAG: HAD family hydrolase [Rhodospirillaceae bacterium]|nr:HAD family hydrolase [Rhodospirillaceae bacterium]